jgi:hypothetical protein
VTGRWISLKDGETLARNAGARQGPLPKEAFLEMLDLLLVVTLQTFFTLQAFVPLSEVSCPMSSALKHECR